MDDTSSLLRGLKDFKGPAPVHLWNPTHCGEIDIRIARDGQWYHEGSPIQRPELMQLFASVLRREPDGSYCLVTPVEKLTIQVDDCPFVAQLLEREGSGREQVLRFTLNTGERVAADEEHPLTVDTRDGEPHPVVHVRSGLDALLARAVFYQLVELAEREKVDGQECLVVWSGGVKFMLGSA